MTVLDDPREQALTFLTLLHGAEPQGLIAITVAPRWGSPHRVYTPQDALPYVVGKPDVYTRIGLLERLDHGRGTANATVQIPGAWVEIDVTGGPSNNGQQVAGGARDYRHAEQVAHLVLPPTLVVASGYGLHAYWLLEDHWRLTSDQDRQDAKQLVAGWQQRIRHEAQDLGIQHVDATHDLARIFRVPGSLNAKNPSSLVPVRLVHVNIGALYTRDQLDAETIPVDQVELADAGADAGGATPRSAEVLLEEHPSIAKIARHEGKAPGKGSLSEWDHWLSCEAVREGLNDVEIAALIAHTRPDSKGRDPAYQNRTVTKARKVVGTTSAATESRDPATEISARWNHLHDPIESGETIGNIVTGDAIAYLRCRSGLRLRIPRLGDLFNAARHNQTISGLTRRIFRPLSPADAHRIAQLVIQLCGGHDAAATDEAEQWVSDFLAATIDNVVNATLDTRRDWPDYTSVKRRADVQSALATERSRPTQTAIMRDTTGRYWLPAQALREHSETRLSWDMFNVRLAEIGWRRQVVEWWEPGVARSVARHFNNVYFAGYDDHDHGPTDADADTDADTIQATIDFDALRGTP
jgi:hypothetical protein